MKDEESLQGACTEKGEYHILHSSLFKINCIYKLQLTYNIL